MPVPQRRLTPEWMDRPDIDAGAHRRALDGLRRVNSWSGTVGRLRRVLADIARQRGLTEMTVLDLACGGGDVAIALARGGSAGAPPRAVRAASGAIGDDSRGRGQGEPQPAHAGPRLTVQGWDKSPTATSYANERAARLGLTNVTFREADVLADPIRTPFDVVICTLFLHHLSDADAIALLGRMREAARHAVAVDDLRRTHVGYALAWLGTRLLSRSPVVHFDGPVSVRAAFRLEEIRRIADDAGLTGARLRSHWPQRFLLTWERTANDSP